MELNPGLTNGNLIGPIIRSNLGIIGVHPLDRHVSTCTGPFAPVYIVSFTCWKIRGSHHRMMNAPHGT